MHRCEADAYLNKGSWRQAAHFAAKNHADDCDAAYQGESGSDSKLAQANTVIISVGGGQTFSGDDRAHNGNVQSGQRISILGAGQATDRPARRGVNAVLQELLIHPEFAISSKSIVVGKLRISAAEFFLLFLQLSEQHADRLLGVWGPISSAREGGSIAWINRGDEKVDIRIPMPIFQKLKTIYKFTSAKQLRGAKFLLVGSFNMLLECRVTDVKQLALHVNVDSN